jgi:hypothetical protein
MSIICGDASSDLVAFEGSALKRCLDLRFLAPGLCLLEDNDTSIHITRNVNGSVHLILDPEIAEVINVNTTTPQFCCLMKS